MPSQKAMMDAKGPTAVRLLLARAGFECDVYEATDSGSQDALNNTPSGDTSWSKKGSTLAARWYPSENEEQQSGGSPYDADNPMLAFPPDTVAAEEDRVDYNGTRYQLDAETDMDEYVVFTAKEVK